MKKVVFSYYVWLLAIVSFCILGLAEEKLTGSQAEAQTLTILKVSTFTRRIVNHHCRPDGWYFYFQVEVEDPGGVPDNIDTITAVNIDSRVDSTTYYIKSYKSGFFYNYVPYAGQQGTYRITVKNRQGEIEEALATPVDAPAILNEIQNISITGNATTPSVSFDPVPQADKYRLSVYSFDPLSGCPDSIFNSGNLDAPSFNVPSGTLFEGSHYYFRLEARDHNNADGDGINDLENRSEKFIAYTPGKSLIITRANTFTETITSYPDQWGSLDDGWYMHFKLDVEDRSGVPGNIESVIAENVDSNVDQSTYPLAFDNLGNGAFYSHPGYVNQRGTYLFTVKNKQGETSEIPALPLDSPVQMGVIQNLSVSDSGETPDITFDRLADAHEYKLTIFGVSAKAIYQSRKKKEPFFRVPPGVMTVGNTYYLQAQARNINYIDADGVHEMENRSVRYLEFTSSASNGSITGTLSYNGTQQGAIYVAAFTTLISCSPFDAEPVSVIQLDAVGDYVIDGLPDGTYYVASAIQTCGGDCDMRPNDPWALYEGCDAVKPVEIIGGEAKTGINMTLVDGTRENPNPFSEHYSTRAQLGYLSGDCSVRLSVDDPDRVVESIVVTGTGISNQVSFDMDSDYDPYWGSWVRFLPSFDCSVPVNLPLQYNVTITDPFFGIIEKTLTINSIMSDVAFNLSPSRGESANDSLVFSWSIANGPYRFGVILRDSNGYIWDIFDVTATSVLYNGPDLLQGQTYSYEVLAFNAEGSWSGTQESFVFGVVPSIYDNNPSDWIIGDFELLNAIDAWATGSLGDFDLLDLIDFWAAGCYQWDDVADKFVSGC